MQCGLTPRRCLYSFGESWVLAFDSISPYPLCSLMSSYPLRRTQFIISLLSSVSYLTSRSSVHPTRRNQSLYYTGRSFHSIRYTRRYLHFGVFHSSPVSPCPTGLIHSIPHPPRC